MNDSKNSSNGLLVLKVSHYLTDEQAEKLTQSITPTAEALGLEPMVLDGGADAAVSIDYTSLLTRLCVAVERLVAQGEPPAVSEEIAYPALNARPTGLNSRPAKEPTVNVVEDASKAGTTALRTQDNGEKVLDVFVKHIFND